MTTLWSDVTAARATGGRATGRPWRASGVVIDSRRAGSGDLFVALPGTHADGNDFAAAALNAGAAAVMATRLPDRLETAAPLLLVDDGLKALQRLALTARVRSSARVIGVTGSVGKTGSKTLLTRALARLGEVHASEGNLNNYIGVPLSLARLPITASHAVFELGMNHPGEIAPLSRLVRPDVALITTVTAAHIGFFQSERDIALAKAEIFGGLTDDGTVVLNRDNIWFDLLAEQACAAGVCRIITFGSAANATVRIHSIKARPDGTVIRIEIDSRPLTFALDAVGAHWGVNAVGILSCIYALGLDVEEAAAAIRGVTADRGRGGQVTIALAKGGSVRLIDESYNASPTAMRAAFAVLRLTEPTTGGRRIAVLGDMRELGARAGCLHAELAGDLVDTGVDLVFTVGPLMRALRARLPEAVRSLHGETSTDIAGPVAEVLRAGDVVLVKGSLGTHLAPVVTAIEALSTPLHRLVCGR